MLRLIDLNPRFIRHEIGIADSNHGRPDSDGNVQWGGFPVDLFHEVDILEEADGIKFLCPRCFQWGGQGTHSIQLFFEGRNTPDYLGLNSEGRISRWSVRGNDYHDLTLAPSIWIKAGCGWHGFVEHGQIRQA